MKKGLPAVAAVLAVMAAAASSSCAPQGSLAAVEPPAANPAEAVAVALAQADAAFGAGEPARLRAALDRLDAFGASPLEGEIDPMQRWREAARTTPPMRGRTLGPGYRSGRLMPGASEQIEQVFLSGQRASVALSAPGRATLGLQVHDRREASVCGRAGNPSHCQWVPTFTERYRIRIANPGPAEVRYYLVVE